MKEAGAESLSFQLLNRNVDQPLPGQADFLVPGMRTPDRGEIATVRSNPSSRVNGHSGLQPIDFPEALLNFGITVVPQLADL